MKFGLLDLSFDTRSVLLSVLASQVFDEWGGWVASTVISWLAFQNVQADHPSLACWAFQPRCKVIQMRQSFLCETH